MLEPKLTRVSDVPVIDLQGNIANRKRVEFRVGDHGPFSFILAFSPGLPRPPSNR